MFVSVWTRENDQLILSWYEHPFSNPSYAPAVSLFSACLYTMWMSVWTQAKARGQYSAILTVCTCSIRRYYTVKKQDAFYFFSVLFFSARPRKEILSEHDKPILSASVANQNAVFALSFPFKFQSLTRQELVSLTRDQALLLFFFPLFFLERGGGGGKRCEKCLPRDMTAKQVRVRPRASITHSYKTRLQ